MPKQNPNELQPNLPSELDLDDQVAVVQNHRYDLDDDQDEQGQNDLILTPMTLNLSRSLVRKLADTAREEGVSPQELAAELVAEGVVVRAWEIVEKKAAMRGGNAGQGNSSPNRPGNSGNGNVQSGNNHNNHSNHNNHQRQFPPGNKMAQKKLQRQTRQHANAMDLMSDKAAFIEYVRSQEKKRR